MWSWEVCPSKLFFPQPADIQLTFRGSVAKAKDREGTQAESTAQPNISQTCLGKRNN